MVDNRPVKRAMLRCPLDVQVDDVVLDFATARKRGEQKARERLLNPVLLAWFDKKDWKHSPAIC